MFSLSLLSQNTKDQLAGAGVVAAAAMVLLPLLAPNVTNTISSLSTGKSLSQATTQATMIESQVTQVLNDPNETKREELLATTDKLMSKPEVRALHDVIKELKDQVSKYDEDKDADKEEVAILHAQIEQFGELLRDSKFQPTRIIFIIQANPILSLINRSFHFFFISHNLYCRFNLTTQLLKRMTN